MKKQLCFLLSIVLAEQNIFAGFFQQCMGWRNCHGDSGQQLVSVGVFHTDCQH